MSSREANNTVFRIDHAHRLAAPVEPGESGPASPAVAVDSEDQVQLQAGQLARHLQDRRRDVDQREAQLNARIAQLESELRVARLWQREQSEEFAQREEQVRQLLGENESRVAAMAAAELALEQTRRELAEETRGCEELLARRESQLSESHQRLAHESERLQRLREQLDQDRQRLEHAEVELQTRCLLTDRKQLEQLHQQHVQEWNRERAELQQQAQLRQRELDAEREALQLQARRWQEEREQQQQVLERDRKQLDQRQATLDRVRDEVLRVHREALEMRLVAEQLWVQLAGRWSPAELTAGVSKLHSQLADEFRFASQDLESQRAALRDLINRLDEKQQQLAEQRTELLAWFRRRQTDLAQKSAELTELNQRLIAERQQLRELHLDHQAQQFQAWHLDQDAQLQEAVD